MRKTLMKAGKASDKAGYLSQPVLISIQAKAQTLNERAITELAWLHQVQLEEICSFL